MRPGDTLAYMHARLIPGHAKDFQVVEVVWANIPGGLGQHSRWFCVVSERVLLLSLW